MALFCQNCGKENAENSKFCMICGARIATSVAPPSVVEPAPAPVVEPAPAPVVAPAPAVEAEAPVKPQGEKRLGFFAASAICFGIGLIFLICYFVVYVRYAVDPGTMSFATRLLSIMSYPGIITLLPGIALNILALVFSTRSVKSCIPKIHTWSWALIITSGCVLLTEMFMHIIPAVSAAL